MTVQQYKAQLEAKGAVTVGEHLDAMTDVAVRFAGALQEKDNAMGMASWWMMVFELGREMEAHLQHAGFADIEPEPRLPDVSASEKI